MIFFAQNLSFSQSFHKNSKFEILEFFWICKMTSTRGLYNSNFVLLNRGRCWTGRVLIPPPHSFFRFKKLVFFSRILLFHPESEFYMFLAFSEVYNMCFAQNFQIFFFLALKFLWKTNSLLQLLGTKIIIKGDLFFISMES